MLNKKEKQKIQLALYKLGFHYRETLVYLAVLENPESSIITVSDETGLSRGTVYDLVEKLKKENYLVETKKGKRRRLVAESPSKKFYSVLEDKHDKLEELKESVDAVLPILKTMETREDHRPTVRLYSGEKGFMTVMDEIFNHPSKEYLSIARVETYIKFVGEENFKKIIAKKVKLGVQSRAINEDSVYGRQLAEEDIRSNRQSKLAPKEIIFPATEMIYGDNIAMFSTKKENVILVIESKDFAETHRAYFEMMWGNLA